MPRDDAYLYDMHRAASLAVQFVRGMDLAAFLVDLKTQAAVISMLISLGESAKRVSPELRAVHPEVDWSSAARTRDRLAHGYWDIDFRIVWETVNDDLPALLERLAPILPEWDEGS